MDNVLIKKRKIIDLPEETVRSLSALASRTGTSVKALMEKILIEEMNSIKIDVSIAFNPSPSGDKWFDNLDNLNIVKQGIKDVEQGKVREISDDELNNILG